MENELREEIAQLELRVDELSKEMLDVRADLMLALNLIHQFSE